jgi:hypothetical protein
MEFAMTTQDREFAQDRRLATLLKADALFCLACALPGVIAPGWLAGFLLPGTPMLFGFPMSTVMMEVGIVLVLSATALLAIALRSPVNRGLVALSAGVDAALVAGTVLLLMIAGSAFSLWGGIALLVVAIDTALIGGLKLLALKAIRPETVTA